MIQTRKRQREAIGSLARTAIDRCSGRVRPSMWPSTSAGTLIRLVLVFVAISCGAAGAAMAQERSGQPFTGNWQRCENYQDATVCESMTSVQSGSRICAVRQDFATSAYYAHRLTGTATGSRAHFDRICGDPGSETNSFCTGQAPEGAKNVGWTSYDRTLHVCKGRMVDDPAGCNASNGRSMARVSASAIPLSKEDRSWLASCAAGVDQ